MYYRILCDDVLLCDSRIEELAVIEPVVELEENRAGSFSFTITPEHPLYEKIHQRKSILTVYQDENTIFCGICMEITTDFCKQKQVYCEGELTYFNDSVQRPARYQNMTVRGLLEAYINNHNSQVDDWKKFSLGIVTVEDKNDSIYCYTNMESTMKCLQGDLIDDLGGFFRVRYKDGIRYLDYLADSQNTNTQIIQLGANLMDFSSNINLMDIATAVIPLGATLEESQIEGLEIKQTIAEVNNGCDYVYNQEAVDNFGWIFKTIEYNDVNSPEILKTKGKKYLSDIQFDNMVIEASAIDLHLLDANTEAFKLSDNIRVVSAPHGLDRYFRLTKMTINLSHPENNVITLGKDERVGLSSKTIEISDEIKKLMESDINPSTILQHAKDNATQLLTNAMNGFVYKTHDELFIMDTDNPQTATKVWRWNVNGLGYSSTGISGPYGLAMTMDGRIVADYISSGIMSGDRVKGGIYEVGGTGYGKDGKIEVKNAEGTTLITLDKNGITLSGGQKISYTNLSGTPTIPTKTSQLTNDSQYATKYDIPTKISELSDDSSFVDENNVKKIATKITQDTIATSTILCDQLFGGTIALGGKTLGDADLLVYNKNDEEIGEWNKEGAFITSAAYVPTQYPTTWYGQRLSTLKTNKNTKSNFTSSGDWVSDIGISVQTGQYEYICALDTDSMNSKPDAIEVYFANVPRNTTAGFGIIMEGIRESQYNFHFNTDNLIRAGRKRGKYVIKITPDTSRFEIREILNGKNIDDLGYTAPWYNPTTSNYGTALQLEHIDIVDSYGSKLLTLWNNISARISGTVMDVSNDMIVMDDCIMKTDGLVLYDNANLCGFKENFNGNYYTETMQFKLNVDGFTHLGVYRNTSSGTANVRVDKKGIFYRYSSSSKRYKEDITQDIKNELDPRRLYDVNIYQFKYKEDYLDKEDDRYRQDLVGFLAEDLYEKYPLACDLDDGQPEAPNYNLLIAPMLKLIQEQNERIKELERKVLEDGRY